MVYTNENKRFSNFLKYNLKCITRKFENLKMVVADLNCYLIFVVLVLEDSLELLFMSNTFKLLETKI